jgi:hypothetical protein
VAKSRAFFTFFQCYYLLPLPATRSQYGPLSTTVSLSELYVHRVFKFDPSEYRYDCRYEIYIPAQRIIVMMSSITSIAPILENTPRPYY